MAMAESAKLHHTNNLNKRGWLPIAILAIIILVGLIVRLDNLTTFTIGHIELYTPGIDLPTKFSIPPPRLNLFFTIGRTIVWEPNPPGYYILMQGWTKVFGTGVFSLRFPSVLFGTAGIFLVYLLGSMERDKLTGLIAAGMMALNGLNIFWSQTSKMYSMGCFFGILSTVLLLMIVRYENKRIILLTCYAGTVLIGLGTVLFFWPIFITHMVWVLMTHWKGKWHNQGLFQTQILVFILASPLLAIAVYASQRPGYIDPSIILPSIWHFFQFGFLFEPDPNAVTLDNIPVLVNIFLFMFTIFLIFIAIASFKQDKVKQRTIMSTGPSSKIKVVCGILAILAILAFYIFIDGRGYGRTNKILVLALLPLSLAFSDFLFSRYWVSIQNIGRFLEERANKLGAIYSLSFLLLVIPFFLLALVSIFSPLFVSRTILLYTPYLIIILSIGMSSLIKRHKLWIALAAILVVFLFFSNAHFKKRLHHFADYKALSEKWIPKIEDTDLIFFQHHWRTSPIFYYLNARQYHFVQQNHSSVIQANPNSRVWVFHVGDVFPQEAVEKSLAHYKHSLTIEALRTKAELFEKQRGL